MTHVHREWERQGGAAPEALSSAGPELSAYAEEDDGETRMFEARPSEPRWLVQVTPFDRRAMGTSRLLSEVELGLVSPQTLVWRGGMHDWLPVERIGEILLGLGPSAGRPQAPRAVGGVLVSSALILLIAAAAAVLLAAGGVLR